MAQKAEHNSKKANFNQKKIERHLVYIEERTQNLAELAKNDLQDNSITITKIEKNRAIKKNKLRYELLEEKLKGVDNPK
jgi:hypothetical protein